MSPRSDVACGDRVERAHDPGGPLVMSASLPRRLPASSDEPFAGTVTVTNRATTAISGTTSPTADVLVTRHGEVVALAPPKDAVGLLLELAPGASVQLGAVGSLERCAPGDGDAPRHLAAGPYELYAILTVHGAADGCPVTVVGGPWPLELR